MIPYVDSRTLSKGAWFFIRHAQDLLTAKDGADSSARLDRLALVSASLKFASGDTETLDSAMEQQALRRLFMAALRLTLEARQDLRYGIGLASPPTPYRSSRRSFTVRRARRTDPSLVPRTRRPARPHNGRRRFLT